MNYSLLTVHQRILTVSGPFHISGTLSNTSITAIVTHFHGWIGLKAVSSLRTFWAVFSSLRRARGKLSFKFSSLSIAFQLVGFQFSRSKSFV